MNAVGGPSPRRMGSQTGIVVGLFDEVFRPGTLPVKPHQQVDGTLHISYEHPVAVLGRVKQLILLALGWDLVLLLIAQGDKAVGLAPAFRLIAELALLVGIGVGRGLPVGGLQLL